MELVDSSGTEWFFTKAFFRLQVKIAYINFLNHCYVDTEVEMKEIYTSNHMWKLFENFLVDICRVRLVCVCVFNNFLFHLLL